MSKKMFYAALLGGSLIVISTFLPWITIYVSSETISFSGLQVGGLITLLSGIIYIISILGVKKKPFLKIVGIIFAVVSIIISIYAMTQVPMIFENYKYVFMDSNTAGSISLTVIMSYGLFLSFIGGIVALAEVINIKEPVPLST